MGRTSRTGSAVFLGLLCVSLAAGVMASPDVAAPNPGAGQTTAPQVTWGDCQRFVGDNTHDIPTAQCTTVPVPISDANPTGPQAQLAVIKVPASGQRIGA